MEAPELTLPRGVCPFIVPLRVSVQTGGEKRAGQVVRVEIWP